MAVVELAASDQQTPLIELDPYIEMDLHLITHAYEDGARSKLTEEGFLASLYGDTYKLEEGLHGFSKTTSMYGGLEQQDEAMPGEQVSLTAETTQELPDGGTLNASAGIVGTVDQGGTASASIALNPPENPFTNCFPCDFRLTAMAENLPLPDSLLGFWQFIEEIKKFIDAIKKMMNPQNFYQDICRLLDLCRIVCPQDLILLLAGLRYLLNTYLRLSLQLEIDWIALIGMIFLPILLLIYALLDMMISISIHPVGCLQELFETFIGILQEGTLLMSDLGGNIGASSATEGSTGTATAAIFGLSGTAGVANMNTSAWEVKLKLNHPVKNEMLDDKVKEVIGDLSSIEAMVVSMSSFQIRLPDMFSKIKRVLAILIEMMGKGMALKMGIMSGMFQILRIIAFLMALINALQDGSICTDPTKPLSDDDIKAVIERLRPPPVSALTPGQKQLVTPATTVDYDTASSSIIVTSTITNEATRVPMCLGSASKTDLEKITQWIEELDAIAT